MVNQFPNQTNSNYFGKPSKSVNVVPGKNIDLENSNEESSLEFTDPTKTKDSSPV